jgi:undecaprenyl diphosphate synthase
VSQTQIHQTLARPTLESLGPVTAEEAQLLERLDLSRLPTHVAVIMDGNGRWAQKRHLPRIAGHRSGTQSARTTIETCARLKIEALTLYAFSVENWRRPKTEIPQKRDALAPKERHSHAFSRPHR